MCLNKMNSVKEILEKPQVSAYTGSLATRECVKKQIEKRWGKKSAERYDPYTNCLTFVEWSSRGYRILPQERSLRSTTFVEVVGADGKKKTYKKSVHLFFDRQVKRVRF